MLYCSKYAGAIGLCTNFKYGLAQAQIRIEAKCSDATFVCT